MPEGGGSERAGPLILALDTAGSTCAVAIAAGGELLGLAQLEMAHGQAEALLPLVDRTMRQVPLPPAALELVAVTIGPGSFTGIRVGLAAARGIALALDVPLIGVSSFEAAIAALGDTAPAARLLLAALESRRSDFFIQLFDAARRPLGAPAAVPPERLAETVNGVAGGALLAIAGDAAPRAAAILAAEGVVSIVENGKPPVLGALHAALRRWRLGELVGPVRPLYLRPPDVTVTAGLSTANHR